MTAAAPPMRGGHTAAWAAATCDSTPKQPRERRRGTRRWAARMEPRGDRSRGDRSRGASHLLVVRLACQHDVQVAQRLPGLREAAVRDPAAQVCLRVRVVDLYGGGAVGEALAVLLELEIAHPAIRVHHVVVLLQPQRVRIVRDRGAVLVRLVRLVALLLLGQRAPLDLRGSAT